MDPLLRQRNVKQEDIEEVITLKSGGHFSVRFESTFYFVSELACRKVFESTHSEVLTKQGITIDDINSAWDHPNRYFDNSYHLHNPQVNNIKIIFSRLTSSNMDILQTFFGLLSNGV